MIYIIGDLHGCYRTYLEAMRQIQLSDDDTLYVLGDMIDRGKDGIKILQDMSMRWNVIPLLGNHEYMAIQVLERFCVEIKEDNYETHLTTDDFYAYQLWMENGGQPTIEAFMQLTNEDKFAILDYLNECSLYEELELNNQTYLLVHAGIVPYQKNKAFTQYQPVNFIFQSNQEDEFPFTMICGHKPTFTYGSIYENKIYQKNQIINIDCGLVYGKKLAVYCLDTQKVIYIDNQEVIVDG